MKYDGYMFSVYDYLKEESIICFKPDFKRGKYKKSNVDMDIEENEYRCRNDFICSLSMKIIENTMPEELFKEVEKILRIVIPYDDEKEETDEIACDIRVFSIIFYSIDINLPIKYWIVPSDH